MNPRLVKKFRNKLSSCLLIIKDDYGRLLDIPSKNNIVLNVEFMRSPTLAHASSLHDKNRIVKHIISLNNKFIEQYEMLYVDEIIPHELAHIICFINGIDHDHGDGWSDMCKILGGSGDAKINMGGIIRTL